ncbi:hypothetical protein BR93DRAFT_194542 [Coniochaeta sp. PMI_546]|nr:hypothetical protein BR93DRAFT_194542 [Coniochaeta sp. PMI_546]
MRLAGMCEEWRQWGFLCKITRFEPQGKDNNHWKTLLSPCLAILMSPCLALFKMYTTVYVFAIGVW